MSFFIFQLSIGKGKRRISLSLGTTLGRYWTRDSHLSSWKTIVKERQRGQGNGVSETRSVSSAGRSKSGCGWASRRRSEIVKGAVGGTCETID
jgi:hypothetical protein